MPSPSAKGALALVFAIIFMDILGSTILSPVLAYIVRQYSHEALAVTLMTVAYSAAQFLAAPLLGRLSDRYGRRPVLLLSILGSAAGYVMFGIGGALSRISLAAPAFAAAGLSLLSVLAGCFVLAESLPPARRATAPLTWAELNPLATIAGLFRRPALRVFLLVQCAFLISGLSGGSSALIFAALGALIANSVSGREQGLAAGVNAALTSLLNACGPLFSGAAYDRIAPAAPFWSSAVLLALASSALVRARPGSRTRRTPSEATP